MSRLQYFLLVILLGSLTALPPYSVDTSLAAMPAMADGLNTSNATIQYALSIYFLGAAAGQVFIGPLSDRFGRRPILYCGLVVFIIAALGAAFSNSVGVLTGFRFVQGMAVAAARVLPRAMARDLYDREDAARLLSYMTVIGGSAPIIAPLVGGHFTVWFGWRSVFLFMAAYAAVAFMLTLPFLKETLPPERRTSLEPRRIARTAWTILRTRAFVAYMLCSISVAAALYAFLIASAPVLIRFLGETPQQFGFDFALVMVAYAATSFIGARLVGHFGIERLLGAGVTLAAFSGMVMAALAWAGVNDVWAVIGPMFMFMVAFSLILPQATAGALSPFPAAAGMATSVLGIFQIGIGAPIGWAMGLLDDGTQIPMTTTIGLMGVMSLLFYMLLVRRLPKEN